MALDNVAEILSYARELTPETFHDGQEALHNAMAEVDLSRAEVEQVLKAVKGGTGVSLTALRGDYQDFLRANGLVGSADREGVATALVRSAQARYELGVSEDGEAFAVPKEGPRVVRLLRGGKASLRLELARVYFEENERAAPSQALADALATLEGFAQVATPTRLHQRVAEVEGAWWVDLGDETGRAVCITSRAWSVESGAPVLFRRTPLTSALPVPEGGHGLEALWKWLNVAVDDRPLIAAYLVAALRPDIPHPILGLFGEPGAGKTTAEREIVSLVDPSPALTRKPPRDAEAWVTACNGSWVVGIDNVSAVSAWFSDSLCRAVTGEGDVRRKLYTDAQLMVFAFRRVVILTGVDLGSLPSDLADRLLPITLKRITEEDQAGEDAWWVRWHEAHARLLGALLDLAVAVFSRLPAVRLERKPRMADFARIVKAVDEVLGTRGFEHFMGAQGRLAADTLTGDPFVARLTKEVTKPFEGTAADLLAAVTPDGDKWRAPKGWPSTPRAVTQRLRQQANVLRKLRWTVEDDQGKNKTGTTRWTLVPPVAGDGGQESPPSLPYPPVAGKSRAAHEDPRDIQPGNGRAGGPTAGLAGVADQDSGAYLDEITGIFTQDALRRRGRIPGDGANLPDDPHGPDSDVSDDEVRV